MKNYLNLPAPAKINLFLHVVGRRADGYHLLESVFTLIDLCDYLDFEELPDGQIKRSGDINWPEEKDLCVKAAKRLQQLCPQKGVHITLTKNIPSGAGLGGGSSNAATTLIALNRLWNLNLSREELIKIGNELGADVPFFIFGQTAFATGTGEQLRKVEVPDLVFDLVYPDVAISTQAIFTDPDLTRDTKVCRIASLEEYLKKFAQSPFGRNDLEKVARSQYAPVEQAFKLLNPYGIPRMTGSGSVVYITRTNIEEKSVKISLPSNWRQWTVKSLKVHPLWSWT